MICRKGLRLRYRRKLHSFVFEPFEEPDNVTVTAGVRMGAFRSTVLSPSEGSTLMLWVSEPEICPARNKVAHRGKLGFPRCPMQGRAPLDQEIDVNPGAKELINDREALTKRGGTESQRALLLTCNRLQHAM